MVNAGAEKNIAVQSPRGSLATASNIPRRRRPPQTRRTVATQSMVTYRREWATPRFTVLPDDLQGTFGEQIG